MIDGAMEPPLQMGDVVGIGVDAAGESQPGWPLGKCISMTMVPPTAQAAAARKVPCRNQREGNEMPCAGRVHWSLQAAASRTSRHESAMMWPSGNNFFSPNYPSVIVGQHEANSMPIAGIPQRKSAEKIPGVRRFRIPGRLRLALPAAGRKAGPLHGGLEIAQSPPRRRVRHHRRRNRIRAAKGDSAGPRGGCGGANRPGTQAGQLHGPAHLVKPELNGVAPAGVAPRARAPPAPSAVRRRSAMDAPTVVRSP